MVNLVPLAINVVGADANNLQNADVFFPHGLISMVVGVSGSGKSSLLRDVIALEGNQRLKEFLGISQEHLGLPVNHAFIDSLPATLHVGQRAFRASSRTTVATASGLLSMLRHLFIQWSKPISSISNCEVEAPTAECYAQWLSRHHQGKITIWAIPLSFVADDGVEMAANLVELGFERAILRSEHFTPEQWEKGREVSLKPFREFSKQSKHLVEVLVGSLDLSQQTTKNNEKLSAMLKLAFRAGNGNVFVETHKSKLSDLQGINGTGLDSRKHWVTPSDPRIYRPADIHLLSFNAPEHEFSGACPACKGLGSSVTVDITQLISDPQKSMNGGACVLWSAKNYKFINIHHETIEGLRGIAGFDPDIPWFELSEHARELVLYGSGSQGIVDLEIGSKRQLSKPRIYPGLIPAIMRHVEKGTKTAERLAFLVNEGHCNMCGGTRWSHAAKALRLSGYNIAELLNANFSKLSQLCSPSSHFARTLPDTAKGLLSRLHLLSQSFIGVGLSHINGSRGMREISEGESRRIRLAAVFDGRHQGLALLLDEPARGLHDEDVMRLSSMLKDLRGQHTLIINDHRKLLALGADHFVELGPGGGPEGGRVIYQGIVPQSWWEAPEKYHRRQLSVDALSPHLHIYGACRNNLRHQDIHLPLGKLISITGLSGSGKSSFVHGVLEPALQNPHNPDPQGWFRIEGHHQIEQVISLDQSTPPANLRSTVATMLDVAKDLREYYAEIPKAKKLNLRASDFGFNGGNGRCPVCLGIGEVQDGSQKVICTHCGGSRFLNHILAIYSNGINIAELLAKSIDQLVKDPFPALVRHGDLLHSICQLGLGHLTLGRRIDTLSGGEIQRLRIAKQLNRYKGQSSLFLFDEPASGLHKNDVINLLRAIDHVIEGGRNTVVLVEHNLALVSVSDWVIEFGPGSGPDGGVVVAAGTPQQIAQTNTATGRMLQFVNNSNMCQPEKTRQMPENAVPCDTVYAKVTLRWLRGLLGHDVVPVSEPMIDSTATPVVVFDFSSIRGQPLIQYGGLERHLLAFALEEYMHTSDVFSIEHFLELWKQYPDAQLFIQPLLQDIYIWGAKIPHTIVKERVTYLQKQGYDIFLSENMLEIRATGSDLYCAGSATRYQREQLLIKALAVGAGYAELHHQGRCVGKYAVRFVDLLRGLVSPYALSSYDFSLKGARGQCPACKGHGKQTTWDLNLIFAGHSCTVLDKELLSPFVSEALKGVHRNILVPFFKRMIKEDLWPADYPYLEWTQADLDLVLYGFWSHPSHGSFLKNAKVNPDEVSSWLRWDGLYYHLQKNLERCDPEWVKEKLQITARDIECPFCHGIGLRTYTDMLCMDNRNYSEWIRYGTVSEFHRWLGKEFLTARQQYNALRLKIIMEKLIHNGFSDTLLFKPASQSVYNIIVPAMVQAFTKMPLILK